MENKRAPREESLGAWRLRKAYSGFTRCSGSVFYCVLSSVSYVFMFVLSLRSLRRVLLGY